jgi:hypothetical protein
MKTDDKQLKDLSLIETPSSLDKPQKDTEFATVSAKRLKDIVSQNKWVSNIKGKEHLSFEAWQTIGKFYGYMVDTDAKEPEYVEYDGVWGFKAHAQVVNEHTGIRVGGASAICMSDEPNWRGRDKFAIMSMAQTRAGSKSLRQILSWVVALAGYAPAPLEEMDYGEPQETLYQKARREQKENVKAVTKEEHEAVIEAFEDERVNKEAPIIEATGITTDQKMQIAKLLPQTGKTYTDLNSFIKKWKNKDTVTKLTSKEADAVIRRLEAMIKKKDEKIDEVEIDINTIPVNFG